MRMLETTLAGALALAFAGGVAGAVSMQSGNTTSGTASGPTVTSSATNAPVFTSPVPTGQPTVVSPVNPAPPPTTSSASTGTTSGTPPTVDTSTLAPSNQTSGGASGTMAETPAPFAPGVGIVAVPTTTETPVVTDYVVGTNGERVPVNRTASVLTAPAAPVAVPELDAAMKSSEAHTRAKVARKGQLLYSIAPRTNNDRSDEMPDDPVSPAITPPR
jgi:hypothetical protein